MESKIDHFNDVAEPLFKILIDKYNYILDEIKIFHFKGSKWSTKLIYLNPEFNLKIEVEQAPFYTDYGFSFFIYNLSKDEYNILYNVPHEKQDGEDAFLHKAYEDLFSSQEMLDLISGKHWHKLNRIAFQI